MKKRILVLTILTGVVTGLTGCGSKEATVMESSVTESSVSESAETDSTVPENLVMDASGQLQILEQEADKWQVSSERTGDFTEVTDFTEYGYAVTDLDGDGMLEIIKSGWAGNGHYSINTIFEVTEQGSIEKIDFSELTKMKSEPDLYALGIKAIIDNDKVVYVVSDLEKLGLESQRTYYVIDLKDDKVHLRAYEGSENIEDAPDAAKWFIEINEKNLLESYESFIGKESK